MSFELLIPVGRVLPLASAGGPFQRIAGRRGTVVRNAAEAREIGHLFGGRAARPAGPVVVVGADGRTPILIVTDGQVEASEMEDIAIAAAEKSAERVKATGSAMPFREYRERHGLPQREEVPALFAQALHDRMAKHRANPRTDPPRQPKFPTKPTVTVPGMPKAADAPAPAPVATKEIV